MPRNQITLLPLLAIISTILVSTTSAQTTPPPKAVTPLETSLETLIFPKVDFRDATVEEMVAFISARSKQLDPSGVGIPINLTPDATKASQRVRLTVYLQDVSASKVLRSVIGAAGLKSLITPESVVLDYPKPDEPTHPQ